jgi:hypothetical protein
LTDLLVLHTLGERGGAAGWRAALGAGGWLAGWWLAPDLPGHGTAPAPAGGAYDRGDPVVVALRTTADAGWDHPPVVIGERDSGVSALVLAAGGRAAGAVLVDGLGGPWSESADDDIAATYRWLRALADDPRSMAVAPPDADPDPRTTHGYAPGGDASFWRDLVASVPVPVLVIETPASPTPPAHVDARISGFPAGCTLVRAERAGPATLGTVRAWWDEIDGKRGANRG